MYTLNKREPVGNAKTDDFQPIGSFGIKPKSIGPEYV
jgi:hypothetical protein